MTPEAREQVHRFVEQARWFGGKGRTFDDRRPHAGWCSHGRAPTTRADGDRRAGRPRLRRRRERHLPAAGRPTTPSEQEQLAHAHIGSWDDDELGAVHAYDALHDHAAAPLWLHALAEGAPGAGPTRCASSRSASHDLDVEARSSFFSRPAEQLLGDLRRGQPHEGLPPGDPGRQPRHRDPGRAQRGRQRERRHALRLRRDRRTRRPARCCSSASSSSSCAPPATASTWPWPACAASSATART